VSVGGSLPAAIPVSSGSAVYVSPSGSDSNSGSEAQPWRTLAKAFGAVSAGQTVYLRAGTYAEWVTFSRSGSSSAPITVRSYPGELATISGRLKVTGSWLRFSGLRFQGRTGGNDTDVLIYVSGGDNIEISGNELTGAAMSAIYIGDPGNGADNVQFLRNFVHDNGTHTNLDHGIYYGTGRGGLIANNLFLRNYAYGIHLYPDCDNAIVVNNTVVSNGRSGVIVGGESTTADSNLVANNVVAFNTDYGVRSYWGGSAGSGNVIRGNLFYGNPAGDLASGSLASGMTYDSNLVADPRFVDRNAGNYRLAADSPALERALAGYSPAVDLDGRSRPQGTNPDQGAYER